MSGFNRCTAGYLAATIAYYTTGTYEMPTALCRQPGSHYVSAVVFGRELYATVCAGCEVLIRHLTGWRWSRVLTPGPGATWFDREAS